MGSLLDKVLANKRFDFVSAAKGGDTAYEFAVVEMEGFEALSQPFRFTLTLVSGEASVDFDAMLANPATFTIHGPDGRTSTPYHGVLAEFDQLHSADGYVFYRAVLVPRLWNLSLYRISEVYLDEQPVTDTLKQVLKNGCLTSNDFDFRLTGSYRPRSFICQYDETHLDFVSRWMEHEGIYYYFDHRDGADRLIVVDSLMMHEKSRADDADEAKVLPVVYRPDDRMDTGVSGDAVRNFVLRQKPLPKEVILQEFNHRKAALNLKASASVSDSGRGQVMLYGEDFRNEDEGRRYAKLRAEEILAAGKVFSGEGTAVGLRAGYFAALSGHYRDDFNAEYLVTEIHHRGSQAGALLSGVRTPYSDGGAGGETSYANSFRAIASTVQFRPERVTPKPRVSGTMNAIVDGEGAGEYAELDEFGQYKVQLPFDLTDKNANKGSARVRMATPYAGSDHGMHFPLLKGAEVLLSFTDGDPDRPVIVGAVPNSENRSVISNQNQHDNRITTRGGNQLHMGDTRGKEVIWLNSPFHSSSIGIGSVDPRGAGSIYTATKGSSDSVTFGNSNSMSFGSKSGLSIGTETSMSAAFSNTVSIGAKLGISFANNISWNMNLLPQKLTRSLTIDDSLSVKLNNGAETLASLDSVTISAGRDQLDARVAALEARLTKARVMMGAFTALNMAQGACVAATINGDMPGLAADDKKSADDQNTISKAQRDADKKKQTDAINNSTLSDADKALAIARVNKQFADADSDAASPMNSNSMVNGWPGIITKVGTDALIDSVAMVTLQKYVGGLADEVKDLKKSLKSVITLDKDKINLDHDGNGRHNTLELNADSATLSSKDTANIERGVLVLDKDQAQLSSDKLVELKAASKTSLEVKGDSATLTVDSGSTLKLEQATAALSNTSGKISLDGGNATLYQGATENGLGVSAAETIVSFGQCGVNLSDFGVEITGKNCTAKFTMGIAAIDANSMIKLG